MDNTAIINTKIINLLKGNRRISWCLWDLQRFLRIEKALSIKEKKCDKWDSIKMENFGYLKDNHKRMIKEARTEKK